MGFTLLPDHDELWGIRETLVDVYMKSRETHTARGRHGGRWQACRQAGRQGDFPEGEPLCRREKEIEFG